MRLLGLHPDEDGGARGEPRRRGAAGERRRRSGRGDAGLGAGRQPDPRACRRRLGRLVRGRPVRAPRWPLRVDDLGGASAELLTDRDTALVNGSRANGQAIFAPEWLDTAALLGTRPRACRPYHAKTKGKAERVIREVKEDFLAWLSVEVRRSIAVVGSWLASPLSSRLSLRRARDLTEGGDKAR